MNNRPAHQIDRPFPPGRHKLASTWPVYLTRLIGRDDLIVRIESWLEGSSERLITLTGPGGVGKTRIAIELLERNASAFEERAWFVSLSSLSEASAVPGAIAWALAGIEPGSRSPLELIGYGIGEGRALLVLDNFEHVIDASEFLLEMLERYPDLTLIVTSRETLRLRSEQSISIPPLDVDPSNSAATEDDATVLFNDCIRAIRPGYISAPDDPEIIAEICRRLDGLPLAIELAAARCRALTPRALLARLGDGIKVLSQGPRDLPERQRTMRDQIAWSYGLLHDQDRTIFRRISVFAGSFTLEAAEFVLGEQPSGTRLEPIESAMVLDGISSLLDKNLLRERTSPVGDQRFSMLQTIREFAVEELQKSGENTAVRNQHALWCLQRSRRVWSVLYRDSFEPSWFGPLEDEHDDHRASLSWLDESLNAIAMLQLASNLAPFWFFHSHRLEGIDWLRRANACPGSSDAPLELVAQALHCEGLLYHSKPEALRPLRASLEIWSDLGDRWSAGASSLSLSVNLNASGAFEEAAVCAAMAREYFQDNDNYWYGSALLELGIARFGLGHVDDAEGLIREAIEIGKECADPYGVCVASHMLSLVHLQSRNTEAATAALSESIAAWRKLGMLEALPGVLSAMSAVALAEGREEIAARLLGSAESIALRYEYAFTFLERLCKDEVANSCRRALGNRWATESAAGVTLTIDEALSIATATYPASPAIQPSVDTHGLTARELEVLRLLAEGRGDREIGEALFISRSTAARHVANIYRKIDVNSRTAAAAWGFRSGLVEQ